MRIACVHVPQFALQSLSRIDPALRGVAVAVVGAGGEPVVGVRPSLALHSPIVLACSRAAWALGVRLGMTASAARFTSSDVRVVAADGALERETVRAIADTLLGAAAVVDAGGRVGASAAHLAMYCEVPSKVRGMTFGGRLLELLDRIGIACRIGIADDRFTAWVAAAHGGEGSAAREDRGVVSVPRGGSAAFLAPRPLSLLAITPEVQHMLEALGVRTLGEFAALPAPSVSRPLEADYQALARGDSGCALRPYAPEAPIREELAVAAPGNLFGGATAAGALAERLALRLAGRDRGALRLELTVFGDGEARVVPLAAAEAIAEPGALAELLAGRVGEALEATARLRVVVTGEAIVGAGATTEEAELAATGEAAGVGRAVGAGEAAGAGRAAGVGEAAGAGRAAAADGSLSGVASRALARIGRVDGGSSRLARAARAAVNSPRDGLGEVASRALARAARRAAGDVVAGADAAAVRDARAVARPDAALDALAAPIDALSAALSAASGRLGRSASRERGGGSGMERSLPWQLSAPTTLRAERRDAHRRTRRARRRRAVPVAQSQLFGQLVLQP